MLRLFALLLLLVLGLVGCHSAKEAGVSSTQVLSPAGTTTEVSPVAPPPPPPPANTPTSSFVVWDKKLINLGPVKRGESRMMFFEFTNTSGESVQIDLVDACECTRVDYPRRPIEPGQKGRLDVVFDSTEKDKAETIRITVVFKNTHPNGLPRIEVVEYQFEIAP